MSDRGRDGQRTEVKADESGDPLLDPGSKVKNQKHMP